MSILGKMLMFAMVKEDVGVDGILKVEFIDRYVYRSNDSLKITCSEIQIMRNLVRRKRKGIHNGLNRRLCVEGCFSGAGCNLHGNGP